MMEMMKMMDDILHCMVITEQINSELVNWWINKSVTERELIIFQAYSKEVLGEEIK
jgi:hypothetical protein